jgi:deoxyribose-phosphate aldolase
VKGTGVKVASVATSFPSGQTYLEERLDEVRRVVADGADEVDMVINRGAFLSGDYNRVFDEVVAVKQACGPAHLKVILETGELQTYDQVAKASHIAMDAGADFIKTSTGKVAPAATLPVSLVMVEALREHFFRTGRKVGFKPAGGIRKAKEAWQYLVMIKETVGDEWLSPDWLRFGASSLLNDVLMQWDRMASGHYQSPVYFSID